MPKPKTAAGYESSQVERVRATCLYVATKLGDLLDELVVVGGLVPTLLIDQGPPGRERHFGTLDLDVGMQRSRARFRATRCSSSQASRSPQRWCSPAAASRPTESPL
jgi:hypothetical protein